MPTSQSYQVALSSTDLVGRMLWDGWKWDSSTTGTGATLTYYFASDNYTWEAWEKAAYRGALQQWSDVANVTFTEVTDAGQRSQVDFVENTINKTQMAALGFDSSTFAFHDTPDPETWAPGTEVNGYYNFEAMDQTVWTQDQLSSGGFFFRTMVHELGHSLGLKHPFDNDGSALKFPGVTTSGDLGDHNLAHMFYTVEAYNRKYSFDADGHVVVEAGNNIDLPGTTDDLQYGYTAGPMAFDIAAVQYLYGATSHNTGDDTYYLPDQNAPGVAKWLCIWDSDGHDTMRYDGTRDVTIDLHAATLDNSDTGGGVLSYAHNIYGGFTIANGVVIEDILAGSGKDELSGNEHDNFINGNGGNDHIDGFGGNDTLWGGGPQNGGTDDDEIIGGQGHDTVEGGLGDDTIWGDYKGVSDQGDDDTSLTGGGGKDEIHGGGGGDTIYGDYYGTYRDLYSPGADADALWGDDGDDFVYGGAGADELHGGNNKDYLHGGADNDKIWGDAGNDTILGGAIDNDQIWGGAGQDNVDGGLGDDVIYGDDEGYPTLGDVDTLKGGGGKDIVHGGGGGDTIYGDYAYEGPNYDPNKYTTGADRDVLFGEGGNDFIYGGGGDDTIDGGDETPQYPGSFAGDYLFGGDGNDTIVAGKGQDLLDGGKGNDIMSGGLGDDSYMVDSSSDKVIENAKANEGYDYVTSTVSFTLGANVEGLYLQGTASTGNGSSTDNSIYGNATGNSLQGNDGNDTLYGYAQNYYSSTPGDTGPATDNDTLNGGAGIDHMYGGKGNDDYYVDAQDTDKEAPSIYENKDQGTDTVYASFNFTLPTNFEVLRLGGSKDVNGIGNDSNNLIYGNSGDNTLQGKQGDDQLFGDDGKDTLKAHSGNDYLVGGNGDDDLDGGVDNDELFGGKGQDKLDGSTGKDMFLFLHMNESADAKKDADDIFGFTEKDKDRIDFSDFDFSSKKGQQDLHWDGNDFSGKKGSLVAIKDGGNSLIEIDATGNKKADMIIVVHDFTSFDKSDFLI